MAVTVLTTASALRDIEKLPATVQVRVADKLVALAAYPQVAGVKALKGALKGTYRVRIGSYRVLFTLGSGVLTVVSVDDRKDSY